MRLASRILVAILFLFMPSVSHAQTYLERIDQLLIPDGRFAGAYRQQSNDLRLDWYFANLGLLPVCGERGPQIRTYLATYLAEAEQNGGTVRRLHDFRAGEFERPDSDDSYAATMLSLAVRHCQVNRDRQWWRSNRKALKLIADRVLLSTQKPSGLTPSFVKAPNAVCYLQDNCEVYRGLSDLAGALAQDRDPDAEKYQKAAKRVADGIAGLFDRDTQAFRVADAKSDPTFYPLKVAQIFPQVFGVPLGTEAETRKLYDAGWKFLNRGGERWEAGQDGDGSLGKFPWMMLGYAAALRGETARAQAQLDFFDRELSKEQPAPQFTAINELGWAIRTHLVLSAPKNSDPKKSVSKKQR